MALLYRMGTGNGSGGDLKPFIVNFTCHSGFIGKTVTMEFQGTPHAVETVDNVSGTVASDGKLTLYPMHDGLWKYYATSDLSGYQEGTITLEKWGNYSVELKDTPNGATVTPTDDVQTWLHCANIWDKSYTTISEVVADTTTLNTLIANENANDYLVRSTTFATDICNNESAMTYIGLNDYCANKLLADSTWCTAICNSTYFEKVLNKSVPTLTSNTGSDGGKAFSSSIFTDSAAYYAFDGDKNTVWVSNSTNNSYVGYKFPEAVCIKKFTLYEAPSRFKNLKLEATNDINDWSNPPLFSVVNTNSSTTVKLHTFNVNNSTNYQYYRIYVTDQHTNFKCNAHELQFYGRKKV